MEETSGDEETTAAPAPLNLGLRIGLTVLRLQHFPLSAMVLLTIPSAALAGLNLPLAGLVGLTGLVGMLYWKKTPIIISSAALFALLVWGKVATKIIQSSSPDTALLLVEFTLVLVSLEASQTALTFQGDYKPVKDREDELSEALRSRLQGWLRNQLTGQLRLALVALGLSIGLLPLAGFTSLPSDQLAISASLALLAVVVLLFLVTHKREPEGG